MRISPRSLLTRLRRFRGLWVLAVAALLFKLLSSSFCVSDGPRSSVVKYEEGLRTFSTQLADVSAPAIDAGSGDCVLGEGSSCHCACAHALPMPAARSLAVGVQSMLGVFPPPLFVNPAKSVASFLRPPIA